MILNLNFECHFEHLYKYTYFWTIVYDIRVLMSTRSIPIPSISKNYHGLKFHQIEYPVVTGLNKQDFHISCKISSPCNVIFLHILHNILASLVHQSHIVK